MNQRRVPAGAKISGLRKSTKLNGGRSVSGKRDIDEIIKQTVIIERIDEYNEIAKSQADIASIDGSTVGNEAGFISRLLNAPGAPHRVPLGRIAILREGSHAIPPVPIDIPRSIKGKSIPVIIDKTIAPLKPPEIGYMPFFEVNIDPFLHMGDRFFIRKTGDRITIAPSSEGEFAIAHQNVYIGK